MDKDGDSYISLFGQRVYLEVGHDDDDKDMLGLKRLSLKERSYDSSLSGRKSSPTIHSLPSEVLMIIFKLLSTAPQKHQWTAEHFAHQRGTMGPLMESSPVECNCKYTWLKPGFHWRLFPYAQARVCDRWRAVLSAVPTLWTRIVVSRVPGDWTHPRELEDYLRWTKDLKIEVYIGKERDQRAESSGFGRDAVSERDMTAQYTAILKPHLGRCTVIDYHLQYSTSLPSLVKDLYGVSECLESLRLVCDEESPPFSDFEEPQSHLGTTPGNIQFTRHYPDLTTLALDGANFILAALQVPELIRCVQDYLTIHHYHHDRNAHPHVDTLGFTAPHVLLALFPRSFSRPQSHQFVITFKSVEFTPIQYARYICKNAQGWYRTHLPPFPIDVHNNNDNSSSSSSSDSSNNEEDDEDEDEDDEYDEDPDDESDDEGGNINWAHIYIKFVDMSDRLLSELTILGGVSGVRIPQRVELQNCVIRADDALPALEKARTVQVPLSSLNPQTDADGYLHIPECSFDTIPFPYPRISLRDIEDPSSIANCFDRIIGSISVSIHSCAGLTDAVLAHLRDSTLDANHRTLYGESLALGVKSLEIVGCANITPGGLWDAMSSKNDIAKGLSVKQQGRPPPGPVWVEHPTMKLDVDGTPSLEWEARFLQVCSAFTWRYVPGDSTTIPSKDGDDDEEMDDGTQDSSYATDVFDSFGEMGLISPELDLVDDEALLAAIWPLTPRGDEVMGDTQWALEGVNRNPLDKFVTGALRAVRNHDDPFLPQLSRGSSSSKIDELFDELVYPSVLDDETLQTNGEPGGPDSMQNVF